MIIFLLPLYSGGEVWERIWNQTNLVLLNLCLKRLHHVTISHDKARSNCWFQWPELFRTYRTVNFCKWDSDAGNLSALTWVQEFMFSQPMQIFYMINQLYQGWLMHTYICQMPFFISGPFDQGLDDLATRTLSVQYVLSLLLNELSSYHISSTVGQ